MASVDLSDLEFRLSSSDDELMMLADVDYEHSSNNTRPHMINSGDPSLILPRPVLDQGQPLPRATLRLPAPEVQLGRYMTREREQQRERHSEREQRHTVIDLTTEPDSPVDENRPPRRTPSMHMPSHSRPRNPRRTTSQRISPPRLARSDSSTFMAQPPSFIDLTGESSPEEGHHRSASRQHHHDTNINMSGNGLRGASLAAPRSRQRSSRQHDQSHPPHHIQHQSQQRHANDQLFEVEIIHAGPRPDIGGFALGVGRRIANFLGGNIASFRQQPHMDFSRSAFETDSTPKLPMEPTPPTRDGFTRDTCAESEKALDRVVICPACRSELAYDPSGSITQPSTGRKRKRSPGEHHFWALKKCGHVYCADCFENRRPTKANPVVGFRMINQAATVNDLRCAVDDCDTRCAAKTEWIGIFL